MIQFERLVAQVMQNAFMAEPSVAKTPKGKKHRITKKVENLSPEQQECLLLLLQGKLATISVHGEMYAYRRSGLDWLIRSLHDDEPEHTVLADFSACSCQDNRFRRRICKHMIALREINA